MSLDERFQSAVNVINNLTTKPSDNDLLEIYGLFKQATVGDCNVAKPGIIDFKGKAKWDKWDAKKGMTKEEAMEKYIAKSQELAK